MSAETNLSNSTEWELSKENVQPLKSGRKVANLTAALAPSSCDYQSKISREKQLFETEIRTYEGDDPLQVWYSYIVWICENFPTGCRDQSTLLERCISLFKDVDKYKHDERYLKIWIQYADLCTDPIDVYDYMHSQSMFSKLAKLYESWAYNLERQGNYKKADEVYTLGINREAQPMEVLTRQHKAFERRLSEFISTNDSPDDINQENDPQRVALGGLKKHGKKGTVGAQRTGHGVTTSKKGGIGVAKPVGNSKGLGFAIFQDDAPTQASSIPTAAGEWAVPPTQPTKIKENTQEAGKWSEAKIKQRYQPSIPFDSTASKQNFTVHIDDEAINKLPCTPQHGQMVNDKVLSTRKPDKLQANDLFKGITMADNGEDPRFKPMYCKDKIYAGATEFSFEELRSARLLTKLANKAWSTEYSNIEQPDPYLNKCVMYPKAEVYPIHAEECQLEEVLSRRYMARVQRRQEAARTAAMATAQVSTSDVVMETEAEDEPMDFGSCHRLPLERSRMATALSKPVVDGMDRSARRGLQFCDTESQGSKIKNMIYHDPPRSETVPASAFRTVQHPYEETNINPPNSAFRPIQQATMRQALGERWVPHEDISHPGISRQALVDQEMAPQNALQDQRVNLQNRRALGERMVDEVPAPCVPSRPVARALGPRPDLLQTGQGAPGISGHMKTTPRGKHLSDTPEANKSGDTSYLTFPSPTVNTKAAIDEVMAMFNNPLMLEADEAMPWSSAAPEPAGRGDFEAAFSNEGSSVVPIAGSLFKGPTFAIYDESKQEVAAVPKDKDVEDQENRPPRDYTQEPQTRPLAGILQPSIGIPVCPLTEQDEEEEEPVEYQETEGARDAHATDITTYTTFSAAAHVASTPFHGGIDPPSFSVSSIQPPAMAEHEDEPSAAVNGQEFACTPGQILSPIFERSEEDYRSSSSSASSTGSSAASSHHMMSRNESVAPQGHLSSIAEQHNHVSERSVSTNEPLVPMNDTMISRNESIGNESKVSHDKFMVSRSEPEVSKSNSLVSRNDHMVFMNNSVVSRSEPEFSRDRSIVSRDESGISRNCSVVSNYKPEVSRHDAVDESVSSDAPALIDGKQTLSESTFHDDGTTDVNPFSDHVVRELLSTLPSPVSSYEGYCDLGDEEVPRIAPRLAVGLGDNDLYRVEEAIGSGAFAKVYRAVKLSPDFTYTGFEAEEEIVALKVQQCSSDMEFYITRQLHSRIDQLGLSQKMHDAFMKPTALYSYAGGTSVLVDQYLEHGTLLDVANKYKSNGQRISEEVAMALTVALLRMLQTMHACDVIHGDLKPDNVLVLESENSVALRLIDFGRSIDMRLFPPGTSFTANCYTEAFQCIEMKTRRPWTTQVDTYGLLGVLHCLFHGEYTNVFRKPKTNRWAPTKSFQRSWSGCWSKLFDTLLNIPSVNQQPSLTDLLSEFESLLQQRKDDNSFSRAMKRHDILMSS